MVGRSREILGLVFAAVFVLTACTGSNSDGDTITSVPASTVSSTTAETPPTTVVTGESSTPTTLPRGTEILHAIDPETGEIVEEEVEIPGPTTYGEVVDAGLEAGIWNELDGLTDVLGYAVGAVPAHEVPGAAEVQSGELSEILQRANAFATSGDHTDEELTDLRHWYELAVPTDEVLTMLVDSGVTIEAFGADGFSSRIALSRDSATGLAERFDGGPQGVRARVLFQSQSNCAPVDPAEFSDWGVVEGCYVTLEDTVENVTIRVLYPGWYDDDDGLAKYPPLALDALRDSVSTYSGLGEIDDMAVLFSAVSTAETKGVLAVAADDAQWGIATIAEGCPITVFPTALKSDDGFQQTIAHEAWHCVQHYSGFPQGVADGNAWYHEGGAEYFSNVVYPNTNTEHGWLWTFDRNSTRKSLFTMSYEAWIWWQYLANQQSPRAVADLHLQMMNSGDGGIGGMSGYGPAFQQFTVDFAAGMISDASGSKIRPAKRWTSPFPTVGKSDEAKVIEIPTEPFVATRRFIEYSPQLRVFESDQTTTNGELAMVEGASRFDPGAWKQVFPEIRSTCEKKAWYIIATTTEKGTHTAKIQIDKIEEAPCDPCVLGTWDLDLDSFEAMIFATAAAGGAPLPPGGSFDFSGHYYVALKDGGVMQQQRDGLVMSMTSEQGSLDFTIDSFGQGEYTADGEIMTVFNTVELFSNVATSVPGLGDLNFGQGASALDDGSGEYQCNTDDMTVTLTGSQPIRFERVDKILSPPTTIAP